MYESEQDVLTACDIKVSKHVGRMESFSTAYRLEKTRTLAMHMAMQVWRKEKAIYFCQKNVSGKKRKALLKVQNHFKFVWITDQNSRFPESFIWAFIDIR